MTDTIVEAAQEIGRRVGLATPYVDAPFGLTRRLACVHGVYPDSV